MGGVDKLVNSTLPDGYGTITIRVVVLERKIQSSAHFTSEDDLPPADLEVNEVLPERDKRPIATFLEEPKRGRQCCVFLINGQRQHALDNQFIVRDLEFKYLRNRMLVIVDCDGLMPEAIAQLMQGSRFQFFEGQVYSALEARLFATLKGDPDLRRLEEEAEEDVSSMRVGDEAVRAALDQLIEAHHDSAAHVSPGAGEAGGLDIVDHAMPSTPRYPTTVVAEADTTRGAPASLPVLVLRPELATLRLRPDERRRQLAAAKPESAWQSLESLSVTCDPPVKELQITRTSQRLAEEIALRFVEPADFDDDEYPIETRLTATAIFNGLPEPRVVDRRIVVAPPRDRPPRDPIPLVDDPSFIRVTSRQPIKIALGGPDVHVRLRWDGKDELVSAVGGAWDFRVACQSPSVIPPSFVTRPNSGRFALLVQAAHGLSVGEVLTFRLDAVGPAKTLTTSFLANVVERPSPRRLTETTSLGSQRRPPYLLFYVSREQWSNETCWGSTWSGSDPGAFDPPSTTAPLTIFINQDMDELASYRDALTQRKLVETTVQQRVTKYTAHVAFHLYQMYLSSKSREKSDALASEQLSDDQMREEIRRVSKTMIRLMDVSQ